MAVAMSPASPAVRVPMLGKQQETQEIDHKTESADDEDHLLDGS